MSRKVNPLKSFRHTQHLGQHYPVEIDQVKFLQKYAEIGEDNVRTIKATDVFNDDFSTEIDQKFISIDFMPQQYVWIHPQKFSGVVDLVIYGIDVSKPYWPMRYEFLRISAVPIENVEEINLILDADFQILETT